ncbi:FRG1-like family-domain-containing protein [Dipodascopsis tothii]|uniref:FRG1-like family-domain-containing protein n=1 Tax=Dipodascopsis tothii TaxID=44089 RepID=UPI0034CF063B
MVSKLTFKNDKKRKREKADRSDKVHKAERPERTTAVVPEEEPEGWVSAETAEELRGPCMLVQVGPDGAHCVATDGAGRVSAAAVGDELEPSAVRQVLVIVPIVQSPRFALKSHAGKFVTVSKYGVCEATAEAIGPEQELEFVEAGGLWHVRSAWGKLLRVAPPDVRCDGELGADGALEADTALTVRVQARFRPRAAAAATAEERLSTRELETRAGMALDRDAVRALRRAARDGRLNEAILDVRERSKTDHRC